MQNTPFGKIPDHWKISDILSESNVVTDYVANGSFASLAENVQYKAEEDYAVLIRLVDFNNQFKDNFVYIDEHAYNFLSKSQLFGGEIIISNVGANVGTVFKCPHLKYKMALAPNSIMVKFNGDNDFYYYWLTSPMGQGMLQSIVTGSAQPKFNKTNFRSMAIPVPPLAEQKKIAAILSSLDEKIETNRKINARLEELAQALFKSWLSTCEDTITIGEMARNILDYTPIDKPKVRLINSSEITEGIFNEYPLIENKNLKGHFKKRFQKGDILYSEIRPRNHHYGYALMDGDEYIISTRLMVIRNDYDKVTSPILYQYLLLPEVEADFTAKTEGRSGTFPQGTYKDLENIQVPYSKKQNEIDYILRSIRYRLFSLNKESARLAALRDALLPKLMSGEIIPE